MVIATIMFTITTNVIVGSIAYTYGKWVMARRIRLVISERKSNYAFADAETLGCIMAITDETA